MSTDHSTTANPLLCDFLKEILDTAIAHNTKGITVYRRAYASMLACPIPLTHPSEARQLDGIGPVLVARLTELLAQHCAAHGEPMPRPQRAATLGAARPEIPPAVKERQRKPYVPRVRSGGYALLIVLLDAQRNGELLAKQALCERAQPFCDASFTAAAQANGFYTAWNAMKGLLERGLVVVSGNPKRYRLSAEGVASAEGVERVRVREEGEAGKRRREPAETGGSKRPRVPSPVALDDDPDSEEEMRRLQERRRRLRNMYSGQQAGAYGADSTPPRARRAPSPGREFPGASPRAPRPTSRPTTPAPAPPRPHTLPTPRSIPAFPPRILHNPTITLILDTRERRSTSDRSYIPRALERLSIPHSQRALSAGDFLWTATSAGVEAVLPVIVERKRLDDLIASVRSGHFHEQKLRLKRTRAAHIVYIVEDHAIREMPEETARLVETAVGTMQVVDGFFVKRTAKLDDTLRYVAGVTRMLQEVYAREKVAVVPEEFVELGSYGGLVEELRRRVPGVVWCPLYSTFAEMMGKSAGSTVRDVFLRMLMCVKGVSLEKARVVQEAYGTPAGLVEAYRRCKEGERRGMVARRCAGAIERRRIGEAVSEKIWEVWGRSFGA